jgi:Ni/Fe-hydrogenase subunit HybB-like protein
MSRPAGRWPALSPWTLFLILLLVAFAGVSVVRFTRGLGATTNLSDAFPWGLWVGFDVLCGVGLAAGAFTLTAIVHLFHLRRFEPIVRSTVLTGFLGYVFVSVALLRPGPAVAHLARDGVLEPALRDVRGGVVRDALLHRAGA